VKLDVGNSAPIITQVSIGNHKNHASITLDTIFENVRLNTNIDKAPPPINKNGDNGATIQKRIINQIVLKNILNHY